MTAETPCVIFTQKETVMLVVSKKHLNKKDDTIDGVHRPSRSLKAALRESKRMEKHPERYKTYDNPKELWDELGL